MFKNLKLKIKNLTAPAVAIAWILYLFIPQISHAELIPVCAQTGNCGICDIVSTAITLGKWLITGAGGLALLVIIFAAFTLVASAGNADKIGTAKKQIVGAVLGMVITFVAFQMVVMIIAILATPSELATYEGATTKSEESVEYGSLKKFLGVPWWSICSKSDLVEQKGSATDASTANCKYWGDDTACEKDKQGNTIKVCCSDYSKETGSSIGRSCTTGTTCPKPPSVQAYLEAQYGADEAKVRKALEDGGINVDAIKKACQNIFTSTDCTSVAGLSQDTINKLIQANNTQVCGGSCIIITGGTERGGHSIGTSHGSPNVVDIDNTSQSRAALEAIGVKNSETFRQPNTYVCDTLGKAIKPCNDASHLHITF